MARFTPTQRPALLRIIHKPYFGFAYRGFCSTSLKIISLGGIG